MRGAVFHTGTAGHVTSLIYNDTVSQVRITTKTESTFYADRVVLCTGAWTNSLIDTHGQLIPKGHCLGHIQLTAEEYARYSKMPVVDDQKWNIYYFPPFAENGVMKVAAFGSGYRVNDGPRLQSEHPDDGIPMEAEEHLRRGMRQTIPGLADKEMFDVRVCWCIDTPDENFLITPHPDIVGIYLATGGIHPQSFPNCFPGSQHGFKFLPRIGHYIALMMEGKLTKEYADCWKWRPGQKWKEEAEGEGVLSGKNFDDLEGWAGSARHGPMAHTWGN